jgi:Icc-related predicted phosphoesterase
MNTKALSLVLAALGSSCTSPAPPPSEPLEPQRIVAFADVHGDFDATLRALRLAGAIDESRHWIGGDLIVVQTGDQLDRGDGEQDILELFEQLAVEAAEAGGEFHSLLGNHELMNVAWDFRYVTPGGFEDFEGTTRTDLEAPEFASLTQDKRARAAAFQPGGRYALALAEHDVILVLGDSVFVHGGVLPKHVEYGIDKINDQTKQWLLGNIDQPDVLRGPDSPIWARTYSLDPDEAAAITLRETLDSLGVKRMVMGHTIQEGGIRVLCEGDAWCLDVGMASHYGGPIEVLEILGDQVTVLREAVVPSAATPK